MLHAVIMAGGSGTRFWPLSRNAMPKQLLNLAGDRSMIQQAVDRCRGLLDPTAIWVVTNERQMEATRAQLPELAESQFLAEPVGRNTAPCIGLAAHHLLARDPAANMLVMPADHVIQPIEEFHRAVRTAERLISRDPDLLALFGVPPTFPSTGFGYIERSEPIEETVSLEAKTEHRPGGVFEVAGFREKPDRDTAAEYLRRGTFFWNCGIFVWHARTILQALAAFEPQVHTYLQNISLAIGQADYAEVLTREFQACPSISIDYAVLERARRIAVIEATFDWDDVGSWQALHRLLGTDAQGNTLLGKQLAIDTHDSIIRSTDEHLVATLGLKNCIIVHTPDATLVADKQDENAIKLLIEALKSQGLNDLL